MRRKIKNTMHVCYRDFGKILGPLDVYIRDRRSGGRYRIEVFPHGETDPTKRIYGGVSTLYSIERNWFQYKGKENSIIGHQFARLYPRMNNIATLVHLNAQSKGFYKKTPTFGDLISLVHSELSEALEEFRNGHKPNETYYNGLKPEGVPSELADVIIRVLDICGFYGIDMDKILVQKIAYNATRDYMHGNKVM